VQLKVDHNPEYRQFTAVVEGRTSFLQYGERGERLLEYRSTFVPPEVRGRGIATKLVKHALDYARTKGFRVIPTCWFVASVIDKNPEYAVLVKRR